MGDIFPNSKGYQDLLARLKNQIRAAQLRAAIAVNQELILLYWGIGREILNRQKEDGWGSRVIERLQRIFARSFPKCKGSRRVTLAI